MKKSSIAIATFLAISTGSASAQVDPNKMNGSDTLEPLTTAILSSNCFGAGAGLFGTGGTATLTYIGGGSGLGESRMVNDAAGAGAQVVSPMSRALNAAACASPKVNAAEGVIVGLDALVVTLDSEQSVNCGSGHPDRGTLRTAADHAPVNEPLGAPTGGFSDIRASGTLTGGAATFASWKDVLKLAFFGIHPSAGGTAGTFAACNNADRHLLLNHYSEMFETGCTAPGACDTSAIEPWEEGSVISTGVKHAYRRGDTSGTTDTFITLLGAPAIGTNPFCNGTEKDDKDPVRRKCDQTEQVCEADGTLGVVLPIVVSTVTNDINILFNDRDTTAGSASLNWCATPSPKLVQRPTCTVATQFVRETGLDANGDIQTELVTGCSATTPRCDCRYPSSKSTGCTHASGAAFTAAELQAYNWNDNTGTSCWTGAVSPSAGVITRYGMLNGDSSGIAAQDNNPPAWGNRATGHPETTKQRCCVSGTFIRKDPRVLNFPLRDPATGSFIGGVVNPAPSYFRIHSNDQGRSTVRGSACVTTAPPNYMCKHPDSTLQIGCLSQANLPSIPASTPLPAVVSRNCSIGFAGFSAVDGDNDIQPSNNAPFITAPYPSHADSFALASIDATKAFVQNGTYPFTRKLFLNSLVKYTTQFSGIAPGSYVAGGSVAAAQQNLAVCYADAGKLYAPAGTSPLESFGFIPLPGGKPLICANMCSSNPTCTVQDNPF